MTSIILCGKSPHQALFGRILEYKFLKCFGCSPLIHNKFRNKFDETKTTKSVFLDYSNQHKGYNCYNLEKNIIYISRNVKFDEFEYSFLNLLKVDRIATSETQFLITLPNLVLSNEKKI